MRRRLRRLISAPRWHGNGRGDQQRSGHARRGDLRNIAQARAVSVTTVNNVRQNLAFALLYNAIGVPIAQACCTVTGLLLSPMIAALAMSLSSVSVIINALRLTRSSR
jgi:P-type Cu+ transporter